MSRVVVAMSGGVDSSTAAALLREERYDVIGITMHLWDFARVHATDRPECCSMEAADDARHVCRHLGIPHYVVDLRRVFEETVIQNFVDEYLRGRTPNPCVLCNSQIKWGVLLRKAHGLGAAFVATGHYARVDRKRDRAVLRRGVDLEKDQSYFLWALNPEQLAATILPLGGLRKSDVRSRATELGLRTARKRESQEICFVPDGDYGAFVRARSDARDIRSPILSKGPIVDRRGRVLGQHRGAAYYTIGQRRGLGIALGRPMYVTHIDPRTNRVRVGDREEALGRTFVAAGVNWIAPEALAGSRRAEVQIRHQHRAAPAVITPLRGHRVFVRFDRPQMAITPGQSAVFYEGDLVLGGGTIEEVRGEEGAAELRSR